jgi:orotate phosphoribosyltransferase
MRARLRDIVARRSLKTGTFELVSGATSSFYFNLKETTLDPEGALLIADLILAELGEDPPLYIGGLEMGAVPIAACVGMRSAEGDRQVRPFYIRKQAKDHGTRCRIDVDLVPGARAAVLEDVTTTGGSALEAAEAVREAGLQVDTVLTVLDRREGAADRLGAAGLRLVPLLTAADFDLPAAVSPA